jgi:hypothetical protein
MGFTKRSIVTKILLCAGLFDTRYMLSSLTSYLEINLEGVEKEEACKQISDMKKQMGNE